MFDDLFGGLFSSPKPEGSGISPQPGSQLNIGQNFPWMQMSPEAAQASLAARHDANNASAAVAQNQQQLYGNLPGTGELGFKPPPTPTDPLGANKSFGWLGMGQGDSQRYLANQFDWNQSKPLMWGLLGLSLMSAARGGRRF